MRYSEYRSYGHTRFVAFSLADGFPRYVRRTLDTAFAVAGFYVGWKLG